MERRKANQLNIVDRVIPPKSAAKTDVSLSAFSFLFSEFVQYAHRKVTHIKDLQRRLADVGYNVGLRLAELVPWKEKAVKRETRLLRILYFISNTTWKYLFGKDAVLERSTEKEDQYMITENEPLMNKYISIPKDLTGLNCGSFLGGIVEGILDAAEFPAKVSTHSVEIAGQRFPRTVILIEFTREVIERDSRLS
jgi:hypothetical protein